MSGWYSCPNCDGFRQAVINRNARIYGLEVRVTELERENAALREDAAVGAAIREFVEQPTDAWEEVNLIIQVVKSGASFSWQAEIDNKVCLFVTNNISGTDFPKQHISVHGDTLAAALAAAGLMEEDGK